MNSVDALNVGQGLRRLARLIKIADDRPRAVCACCGEHRHVTMHQVPVYDDPIEIALCDRCHDLGVLALAQTVARCAIMFVTVDIRRISGQKRGLTAEEMDKGWP